MVTTPGLILPVQSLQKVVLAAQGLTVISRRQRVRQSGLQVMLVPRRHLIIMEDLVELVVPMVLPVEVAVPVPVPVLMEIMLLV